MLKRTLYFSQDAYLSVQKKQLLVRYPNSTIEKTVPIEDIGIVVFDHYRLTLSAALLQQLLAHNVAVICCNQRHLPAGLFLPLDGHSQQLVHTEAQIKSSAALKARLWKQIVRSKISNQAAVLQRYNKNSLPLERWAKAVKNGDPENKEARAAAYYWPRLMEDFFPGFARDRFGAFPNGLFNYGYTILRAAVARALVASGLLPTLGIHHHNKYTAYGLADDIMEPYRPIVDQLVVELLKKSSTPKELTQDFRTALLKIPTLDVGILRQRCPLMVGVQHTTASLQQAFQGSLKQLKLPQLV